MKIRAQRASLAVLTMLAAASVSAKTARDPSPLVRLQGLVPKPERTQVMVLGTLHFQEIGARFQPSMVELLLRQLAAFEPDVIAVEMLAGPPIHELELRSKATPIHEELLSDYAGVQLELGHEAQGLLGLDMIQASKSLVAPKDSLTGTAASVDRTLRLLAAYELPSALLTWSKIPAGDEGRSKVPAALASKLDAQLARVNEVQAVAVPLARRVGLTEIAGVDEFEAAEEMGPITEALMASVADSPLFAAAAQAQVYRDSSDRREAAVKAGDLLPYLRYLNSPAYMTADVDTQWGLFLRTRLKNGADRGRLALWENRNLKIAGRIRALSARHPGKRILVIYGVAHKPFLDAYLGACSDLQIVQPSTVLDKVR